MLEIQDLHVKFHSRDREAVGGVSLTIENGSTVSRSSQQVLCRPCGSIFLGITIHRL